MCPVVSNPHIEGLENRKYKDATPNHGESHGQESGSEMETGSLWAVEDPRRRQGARHLALCSC